MTGVRVWPIDDREIREGYIIRDDAQMKRIEDISANCQDPRSSGACMVIIQHWWAVDAMLELKAILDAYTAGRVT